MAVVLLLVLPDAAAQNVRQLEAGFERDVNRYRWTAAATLVESVGGWNVAATNRFASDAFILFADRLSFRDENQLAWTVDRGVTDRFSTRTRGRSSWFTQSDVFSQEIYTGLRYEPGEYLWLEPAVGLAWDRRPGVAPEDGPPPLRMDAGPAYGLKLNLSPQPIEGYLVRLQADGAWQVINPRRGRAVRAIGSMQRAFEQARLSTLVEIASFRRDAYQAVSFLNRGTPTNRLSETVEATSSDTLRARIDFEAPVYQRLRVATSLDFSANDRSIRTLRAPGEVLFFDTDFNRRSFDAEMDVTYDHPRLTVRLAARGGAETEQRQLTNREDLPPTQAAQKSSLLQQADYDQGHLSVHARGQGSLGRRLTYTFNGTASILRHDTPAANVDDRDELYHNGSAGLQARLSRYLDADVQLFGTFTHTVYLNASRSGENNVQRSLRLRPAVTWRPSARTQFRLSSEIRATYTVDDFIMPGRRPTDQSARESRYDGHLEHDFGGGMRLLATGSMSDLQLGRLLWNEFAEIPFDTLRTYSGWIRIQTGRRTVAEVGLRLFIRSDFDRATTVRYPRLDAEGVIDRDEEGREILTSITRPGRSWIEQIGPTCSISWPMAYESRLRLDGWFNVQNVRQHLYGELPTASADRIRRAGRAGTTRIFPNLALTMLWKL